MAYASWSVIAGEQPTTSKWNILGTNDSSFNDGSGIFGLNKAIMTTDSNPYKFLAARTTALNSGGTTPTKINFATELYDTNANYDNVTNFRYTCPVTGFYWIFAGFENLSKTAIIYLYKNGSNLIQMARQETAGSTVFSGPVGGILLSAVATDYFEIFGYTDTVSAYSVNTSPYQTFFGAYLVSRT